jgi:hypothetical protein
MAPYSNAQFFQDVCTLDLKWEKSVTCESSSSNRQAVSPLLTNVANNDVGWEGDDYDSLHPFQRAM